RAFGVACESRTLPRFRMRVTDPAARYLHGHDGWNGVAGDYEVSSTGAGSLGSGGADPDLTISVADLTRIWLGVVPSTTLLESGRIEAPRELAGLLDEAFAGPLPRTDWLY
ncbi:MAG: sterol carrier protein domain-containing protein, partial [Spirochaetota bacterium]